MAPMQSLAQRDFKKGKSFMRSSGRKPRSGKRSVAHGVSHGIKVTWKSQPRRGGTISLLCLHCSAAPRLMCQLWLRPTARAVGYRSSAAPRLKINDNRT